MAKKGFLEGYKTYDSSQGFGNPDEWRNAFRERMTYQQASEIIQSQQQTPYQLLGIPASATLTEIKKAFRQLILQWHPDKNNHRLKEAEAVSKKIIAAYTYLTASINKKK